LPVLAGVAGHRLLQEPTFTISESKEIVSLSLEHEFSLLFLETGSESFSKIDNLFMELLCIIRTGAQLV